MKVEIDNETVDNIIAVRLAEDIKMFSDMLLEIKRTGTFDGIYSNDIEEETQRITELLETTKVYYTWYSVPE